MIKNSCTLNNNISKSLFSSMYRAVSKSVLFKKLNRKMKGESSLYSLEQFQELNRILTINYLNIKMMLLMLIYHFVFIANNKLIVDFLTT